MPLMYEQYVTRPETRHIQEQKRDVLRMSRDHFLTGSGMVRAIPGPVFSIGAFTGGMALRDDGIAFQLLGCLIGCVAIFLPSALLVLFFFPVWQYLKKYAVIYRSLEGINAAVVGIMAGATCYLITDTFWYQLWQGIPIAFADLAGYTQLTEEVGDEEAAGIVERFVADEMPETEEEAMNRFLTDEIEQALSTLPPRDAKVLRLYFGLEGGREHTLEEIGSMLGVTRERVRQLRDRALKRLREGDVGRALSSFAA